MVTVGRKLIRREGPGFKMVLSYDHIIKNEGATFIFSSCKQNLCCWSILPVDTLYLSNFTQVSVKIYNMYFSVSTYLMQG